MPTQHPGKVLLQQYLEPQQISQNGLARAIKVPPRRINEIIHEKRGISADTAVRLAVYFGVSASYWLHLQAEHDIEKVRKQIEIQLSLISTRGTHTAPTSGTNPDTAPGTPPTSAQENNTQPPQPSTSKGSGIKKRLLR